MNCQCQEPQIATQPGRYLNQGHPCFSTERHGTTGRIHLAVAPECNVSCNYCVRKFDCANESRPGVTSKVITPEEAVRRVLQAKQSALGPKLNVVGIAGPGEPLANEATFKTLALIREHFPALTLCLSTNGLFLPEKLDELLTLGVSHVTVTMNTLSLDTASAVYSFVKWQGQTLIGRQAVSILLEKQMIGLEMAAQAGLIVKVNTVVIPGVNDHELETIAHTVKRKGAHLHNLLPLIPQGKFAHRPSPSPEEMRQHRKLLSPILPQMSHCQQCRADAIGLV